MKNRSADVIVLKMGAGRWPNAERYTMFRSKPNVTSIQGCEISSLKQSKDCPNAKSLMISKVMKFNHLDYSFAR